MRTKTVTILLLIATSLFAQEAAQMYEPPTNFFEVGFCCYYICDFVFISLIILAVLFIPLSVKAVKNYTKTTSSQLLLPLAAISFLLGCLGALNSILTIPAFPPQLNPELFTFQQKLQFFYENLVYLVYTGIFSISISISYLLAYTARIVKHRKVKEDNQNTD